MKRAGQRYSRIGLYSIVTVENDLGEPVGEGELLIARPMAMVNYGQGVERREAAANGTTQPATFTVLANTKTRSVTTRDIIRFAGAVWAVYDIAPLGLREIQFTAKRRLT